MPATSAGASVPARLLVLPATKTRPPVGSPWQQHAVCAGEDPDIFFPDRGDPGRQARRVCARCPVRADCLEYATVTGEQGIWGGLDDRQRGKLRRARRDVAGEAAHG